MNKNTMSTISSILGFMIIVLTLELKCIKIAIP